MTLTTLDDHSARHGYDDIDLLKVDVEGAEALVLQGAEGLLAQRRIHVVTLEYSNLWNAEFGRMLVEDGAGPRANHTTRRRGSCSARRITQAPT